MPSYSHYMAAMALSDSHYSTEIFGRNGCSRQNKCKAHYIQMRSEALTPSDEYENPNNHKSLKLVSVITYRGALKRGDVFLCLPYQIRCRIFNYVLASFPELLYIEVPDTRDFNIPGVAYVRGSWYTEICQLIIQKATFSISTVSSLYNLLTFLDEFEQQLGYSSINAVEFTDLALFEKGEFNAPARQLLLRCRNLSHVSLLMNWDDLIWTLEAGVRVLDVNGMVRKFDFDTVAHLQNLKTVSLNLLPFMALEKRLSSMEADRSQAAKAGNILPGVSEFWGLAQWLKRMAQDHMRVIEVNGPIL